MSFEADREIFFKDLVNYNHLNNYSGSKDKVNDYENLELVVHPTCNLGCTYCYIHRYGHELYPKEIRDCQVIVKNTNLVMDWIIDNNYSIKVLDIFSGELFAQNVGHETLDCILSKLEANPNYKGIGCICIPTNFTFILNDDLTKRVESYYEKFKKVGVRLHLSASFDGAFIEDNRPMVNDSLVKKQVRDDSYYDKCFAFVKKHNCGLHPMIYSNRIEQWIDNFKWFQDKMEKAGISWEKLFLLQVRNKEWTTKQCTDLKKFVKWLYKWSFDKCNRDKQKMLDFLYKGRGFHILLTGMGKVRRGLTCAIQSELTIRLADLKIFPCHRLMYDGMEYGQCEVKNNKIQDIKGKNVELFTCIQSTGYKNYPYCQTCQFKHLCIGGCLGSQYEENGDMFVPIPTVCYMQHSIILGLAEAIMETDTFDILKKVANRNQVLVYETIIQSIKDGKEDVL